MGSVCNQDGANRINRGFPTIGLKRCLIVKQGTRLKRKTTPRREVKAMAVFSLRYTV